MQIEHYELRPKPAGAVQWDGTAEMAAEIGEWISNAAERRGRGSQLSYIIRTYPPADTVQPRPPEVDLEIEFPIKLSLGVGDYLVFDPEKGRGFKVFREAYFNDTYVKRELPEENV